MTYRRKSSRTYAIVRGKAIRQVLKRNFRYEEPSLVKRLATTKNLVGYSSHGEWSTLSEIRELERERGNRFPRLNYLDDTPAIWLCLNRRKALRYLMDASEWDRIDDESQPLTQEEKLLMREMATVKVLPTDIVAFTDGDDGYLILRP